MTPRATPALSTNSRVAHRPTPWIVTGPGTNDTYTTQNINHTFSGGDGNYQISLSVDAFDPGTGDTQTCATVVKTVVVAYPNLTCDFTGDTTPNPDGNTYTYNATTGNVAGRTLAYEWFVNNVSTGVTTASYTTAPIVAKGSFDLKVEITPQEGGSPCETTKTITIDWPSLSCSINGNTSVIPTLPDQTRIETYDITVNGLATRTATYAWNGHSSATTQSINLEWQWNEEGSYSLGHDIQVIDPDDGTVHDVNCGTINITVAVPNLTCNAPSGDRTPVIGETVTYNENLNNLFGRTITSQTWDFEQETSPGVWTPISSGVSQGDYTFTFNDPGETYRVRYAVSVSDPVHNCQSNWVQITTPASGTQGFTCDAWNGGDTSPASPTGSYAYSVRVDNTNGYNLNYTWVLVDKNGNDVRTLGTQQSTIDGVVTSAAFSGADLVGPLGEGDYTIRVDVQEVGQANTNHTCSLSQAIVVGSVTVNYTYVVIRNNTQVEVGESICLTNTSDTSHGDINSMTYAWDFGSANNSLGSQTSTAQQPGCISFNAQGTYTILLTGTNANGLSDTNSVTFNVWDSQYIAIQTTGGPFAPAIMQFDAITTNITGNYVWTIYDSGNNVIANYSGASLSTINHTFGTPDTYRVSVTGDGNLGTSSAETTFTLDPTAGVRAAFTPSVYGGVAPMQVCFTDQSTVNDPATNPIVSWTWNFGNGQTLAYTNTNIPGSICTTYTTGGSVFNVTLDVVNQTGLTAQATNILRTYTALERSASFSISPQGGGRYCFTANLSAGVSVTSWEMGDGTIIGTGSLNSVCYTYMASGTYLVKMNITDGSTTGTVVRELPVDLTSSSSPQTFTVVGDCSYPSTYRTPTFTVTLVSGSMGISDVVRIRDSGGNIILIDSMLLTTPGQTATFSATNQSGTVTFETQDTSLSATTDCDELPIISVVGSCNGNNPIYTVSNTGGAMYTPQAYTIQDSGGNTVDSSNIQLPIGPSSQVINLTSPSPYETYTFISTGTVGNFSVVQTNCASPPVFTLSSQCTPTAAFIITNTGADMVINQTYTVVDSGANPIITATSFSLTAGSALNVPIPNTVNPYDSYTLTVNGYGSTSLSMDCADPIIVVTSICSGTPTFTITNNGGDMAVPQAFTVVDGSGNDVTPTPNTFNLTAGSSVDIQLTGLDPYDSYTLSTSGFAGTTSHNHNCDDPAIVVTSVCADSPTFVITNTGTGDMVTPQTFTIVNGSGADVTPTPNTVTLTAGSSTNIVLTGLDPYDSYTLTTTGFAGTTSHTHDCDDPAVVITSVCSENPTFTITNNGTGDMLTPQTFTIVNGSGADVTPTPNSILLTAGGSMAVTLTGFDPYDSYTLTTAGFGGTTVRTHDCDNPTIVVTSVCADNPVFVITNNGPGDMLTAQTFTVVDSSGNTVATPINTFTLNSGSSLDVTISVPNPYDSYTLTTAGFGGTTVRTHNCNDPQLSVSSICANSPTFIITNTSQGNMTTPQTFSVVSSNGTDVTPPNNSFSLGAGASMTVELTGMNPYDDYTLSTTGLGGSATSTSNCDIPFLTVSSSCEVPLTFTITNTGGDMLTTQTFTVTDVDNSSDVTPPNNSIQLTSGSSTNISISTNIISTYTLTTSVFNITTTVTDICDEETTDTPSVFPGNTPTDGTFAGLSPALKTAVSDWATVPTCGFGCVPYQVYHTNETGNWEIFRLDGADPTNRETFRINLSHGEGDNVDDMAPSRSPNGDWIVFTSNRDSTEDTENWEIYIASTSGDPDLLQRVTYNSHAIDTDPIWGPNEWIVYETSRHGNWELYVINSINGEEYRLTDHEAQDINPAWSPDGSKIIFQSDRDGFWQIYEADLNTFSLRRLSDLSGPDVDGYYAEDGSRIAFRSYRDDGENSVIYLMNPDGSNPMPITQPIEDATNHAWSPDGDLIAYQSDLDGDLDIYVYDLASGQTRLLTDNDIPDYAPTWRCTDDHVVFTSDIMGNPDIFNAQPLPINDPAILVEEDAEQMTYEESDDVYPQNTPSEENASREGQTVLGDFGQQTIFLEPDTSLTRLNFSIDTSDIEEWTPILSCTGGASVAQG